MTAARSEAIEKAARETLDAADIPDDDAALRALLTKVATDVRVAARDLLREHYDDKAQALYRIERIDLAAIVDRALGGGR